MSFPRASRRTYALLAFAQSFVADLFAPPQAISGQFTRQKSVRKQTTAKQRILPAIETVERWFDEINSEYFGGSLPSVRIIYSKRMRCAGSYTPLQKTIRLGVRYHELFPDQLRDTLKHEMIHILNPTHNRAFKTEAARIGASRYAEFHPSLKPPPKYLYSCPQCALEYPRRKRLRLAHCGKCAKREGMSRTNKLVLVRTNSSLRPAG